MSQQELSRALNLGQISQVGVVVRDLSEAIESYEGTLGIGPFAVLEFRPDRSFVRGRDPHVDLRIGVAQLTPEISLELIEVVGGEPYHRDFLEEHGPGVQHLGFLTDDYDGVLARAEALGIPVLMSAETDVEGMGHVRAAYLDTVDLAGVLCEVIEIRPFEPGAA